MDYKKLNNIIGWTIFAIAAIVYCITIERTASFWDCGEYIACAYRLEVGHPPGAPFFMLMGRVFTLFGGTDPAKAALMINVMSALASAFSILFLFWTITKLAVKLYAKNVSSLSASQQWATLVAGAVGSLACTFSDTFWFNAVEGEVYATSSLFTAIVFWAILKWDEEDSIAPSRALRWLILISYLVGISIGVHLLSLLTIPAICFVVYFKKFGSTRKGFSIAGFVSLILLVFVQDLLIPKIVKFVSDYEVFFTNKLHFGFSSGTVIYFLLLVVSLSFLILYTFNKNEKNYKIGFYSAVAFSFFAVIASPSGGGMATRLITLGGILYAIHKFKTQTLTLHAIFLSFATLLIGYSSFFILVIRSQANPPMDENDPENAPNMLSYLLREQYGAAPLVYGQYYNAPALSRNEYGSSDPVYAKDKTKNNYKIIDARKNWIPKYEKEFCTFFPRMYSGSQASHVAGYKYWGNVSEHHKTKISEDQNGETETIQVPTFGANLIYFLSYQVNYMYLRYFYWNFIGRQNDVQGLTNNNMEGNWVTGIKAIDDIKLDTDTSQVIHRDKNNFANNHFYALPFILGLMGMIFHFKRKKQDAWVVLCLFLVTGLAIILYLNQSPYQVRERDYAYVGSFYAFTIWIGFGVLYLHDLISKRSKAVKLVLASTLLCLIVPGIMAKEGWNDHNRALRSLSRDSAIDYLESCAPNAILFTNGDNDTFPLWYAQEVEGIRTDVRVICLSLLSTDWYIKQARRAAYLSKPVPFSIPEEKLEANKLEVAYIDGRNPAPMNLKDALAYVISSDPALKADNGGETLDILPSKNFYLNIDTDAVIKNKVVGIEDTSRIEKKITWDLGNRNLVLKSDLMVLDLIANNNWERPIYFTSQADETCVGLRKYLQLEGLAYRFVPIKQNETEEAQGGRVNTEVMYNNVMTKYLWGGMDKKGVNLDENCLRSASFLRMNMGILASALINKGETKKAKIILDTCLQKMPDENVPFDMSIFNMCAGYFQIGENEKASKLSKQLFDIYEGDLKIYNSQNSRRKLAYTREIEQAKWILKNLTGLSQQFKQKELSKDFIARIQAIIPPEELQPQGEKQPLLQ